MRAYLNWVFLFLIGAQLCYAQKSSQVTDNQGQAVPFAQVHIPDFNRSYLCDSSGYFEPQLQDLGQQAIISALGHKTDTITLRSVNATYAIESSVELQTVNVATRSKSNSLLFAKSIQTENINETELFKAACCNLAESFETNPSVDASFSDGASGSKTIKLLGLGGKYALLSVENIPKIRGNGLISGISSVSGTWIESIQILKGNSSASNGFEGLSGQINTQLKGLGKTIHEINLFGNNLGRWEFNGVNSIFRNPKNKSALLWNVSGWHQGVDQNKDGYFEVPEQRQYNLLYRQSYQHEKRIRGQVNINYNANNRTGGNTNAGFPLHLSEENYSLFGSNGILLNAPGKNFGIQYLMSKNQFQGDIGPKTLHSNSEEAYLNLLHQNYIGNTNHKFETGLSMLYEKLDDKITQSDAEYQYGFQRLSPGVFIEYDGRLTDKDFLTLGIRADYFYHKLYILPRFNYKHDFNANTTFRLGYGEAVKSNYFIAENYSALINTRAIKGLNKVMMPEQSCGAFTSIWKKIKMGYREMNVLVEYHYQRFSNRYMVHFEEAQLLEFKQHKKAFSQSALIQIDYEILPRFDLKIAYKYHEQWMDNNAQMEAVFLIPNSRSFVNLSYETRNKWLFNTTINRIGRQQLPVNSIRDFPRGKADPFFMLSAQVSKTLNNWRFYLGGENLLNQKQSTVWFGLEDNQPEASILWQSPIGTSLHLGINYVLNRK